MMDDLSETLALLLFWTLLAAWRTLPLFAVVLLGDRLWGKRIPPRVACLLWLLVVVRLLLPVSATSPLAFSGVADQAIVGLFTSEPSGPSAAPEPESFTYIDAEGEAMTVFLAPSRVSAIEPDGPAVTPPPAIGQAESVQATEAAVSYQQSDVNAMESDWESVLSVIAYGVVFSWMLGVMFFMGRGWIAQRRFARQLRRQTVIEEQPIIDLLLRACDHVGVGRRPLLKQVDQITSPAIFGIWRPVICLPSRWREQLSDEELGWVFRHELAHVKRRDGLVLSIAAVARSLHWFHPLAWIAYGKLRKRVEQAADETATRDMDPSAVARYGDVLLRYAQAGFEHRSPAVVGLLAMASRSDLGHRIEALQVGNRKRRWWTRVGLLALVAMLAVAGLTDAGTPRPPAGQDAKHDGSEFHVVMDERNLFRVPQHPLAADASQATQEIQVDVSRAIEKAEQLQPGVDAEAFIKTYFATHDLDAATVEDGVLRTQATRRDERRMRDMLAAFEQVGLWQIAVECRLIATDVKLLRDFDWEGRDEHLQVARLSEDPSFAADDVWEQVEWLELQGASTQPTASVPDRRPLLPVRACRVSERDFAAFMRRCQQDVRSNILFAPKVTLFNAQSASICDVVQRPFVTDLAVVQDDHQQALQPKITVLNEGWTIRLKPCLTEQGDVDFRCVLTQSKIAGVRQAGMPFRSPHDPDHNATVQVPTLHSESISIRTRMPEEEVLLVFSPQPYTQEKTTRAGMGRVYAIRMSVLPDDSLQGFVAND